MILSDTVQSLFDDNASKWERRTIRPGDYLYQPADVDPNVYLLEKGLMKIGSLGEVGQRVLYDLVRPGELFGDLDYLDEVTFFEYAQAATSVSVFAIDRPTFRHAVTHKPLLAEWFNELVIRRWHRAETRLLYRNSLSVEDRIRSLQKQYVSPVADADNQEHRPFDHLSYQDIGDLVGATRQTVSRKLQTLSKSNPAVL